MIVGAAAAIGAGVAAMWAINTEDNGDAKKAGRPKSDLKKQANRTRQNTRKMHSRLRKISERYPESGRRVSKVSWRKAVATVADIESAADIDEALEFFLPKEGPNDTETEVVEMNRRVTNLKNLKVDIKKTVSQFYRDGGELQQPND